MALSTLTDFWKKKSIKLSDTFDVYIDFKNDGSEPERFVECCGFTIPKLEYEEETYAYGNMEQIFLIPKYDSCKELVLEFFERMSSDTEFNSSVILNKFLEYISLDINQKYIQSNGINIRQTNYGNYIFGGIATKYIPKITIKIMDNKLRKYVYEYSFYNLQVVNYTLYNLDYQSDSPCTLSVSFSFEDYKKENLYNDNVISYVEGQSLLDDTGEEGDDIIINDDQPKTDDNVAPPETVEPEQPTYEIPELADEFQKLAYGAYDREENGFQGTEEQIHAAELATAEAYQLLADIAKGEKTEDDLNNYIQEMYATDNPNLPEGWQDEVAEGLESGMEDIKLWNQAKQDNAQYESNMAALEELENLDLDEEPITKSESPETKPNYDEISKNISPTLKDELTIKPKPDPAIEKYMASNKNEDVIVSNNNNGHTKIQEDKFGNKKLEGEEGTLYRTKKGKDYYQDKQSGKMYENKNGEFVDSKAKEALVKESRNGQTEYYTSVVDTKTGDEVYREKNVTTEVMTSETKRIEGDNRGQSRTPSNIGANESGSQNNTTVSQTSEGGGQSAHDAAEESRKKKEAEMKAAEEAKKTKAMEEARRGQTRGAAPARDVAYNDGKGPNRAGESEQLYKNGANG